MTYQNFRGADLQEALSAVKATLGPNALIEGTRRVSNGRGGALGQQYVEVTAAPPQGLKWPFASPVARPIDVPLRERAAMAPPSGEQRSLRTKNKYGTVLGMDGNEVERELNVAARDARRAARAAPAERAGTDPAALQGHRGQPGARAGKRGGEVRQKGQGAAD